MKHHMDSLLLSIMMTCVAAASGLVGSFALHRRMSLVADAFSHIALPGIGIALLVNANPLYGGIAALSVGALLIWALEEKTHLPTENIVGIIFTTALAAGALLTPEHEILEVLFGGVQSVSLSEFFVSTSLGFIAIVAMITMRDRLMLLAISPEISQSMHIKRGVWNFLFLAVFSLTVILGLKFLGILLMGALIIIPAAIAKMFSWNQRSDMILSSSFAMIAVNVGYFITKTYGLDLGPTIALTCAGFFATGLLLQLVMRK
ncbi:MAG: metal ABC transporter permease [bacterium]|nr:metal ABC transporter permease [bacterium]